MSDEPVALPSAAKRRPGRPPKPRAAAPVIDAEPVATAPKRPEMRLEDPRAAAAKRAAEILGNFDGTEMANDEFVAPEAPDGWSYEWKRKSVYNQEDPGYAQALQRTGWEPVPATRHPEMMPVGNKGLIIERKGMVLMERPAEVTARFRENDRQKALNQVRAKEAQLNQAPQGQFERQNKDTSLTRVKKGFEPMEVPGDK